MKQIVLNSLSPQQTMAIGKKIAEYLKPGDIVCLLGELGSGKTTLMKGIASGLKIKPTQVTSPTFVLMNIYEGRTPIYHFDLYRLNQEKEILALHYEEYFYGDGICVVEWPQKLGSLLPKEYLSIELLHQGEDHRTITLKVMGTGFKALINHFKLKH